MVYLIAYFQTYPYNGVPVSLTGVKVNSTKIEDRKITLLIGKYIVRGLLQSSLLLSKGYTKI